MRLRNYCFTSFVTEEGKRDYENFLAPSSDIRFAVWQLERCPTTGKEHLQGYIELHRALRRSSVTKFFPAGVHLEQRKGSQAQAIAYCEKSDSRIAGPWRCGSTAESAQGHRSDLDELTDLIKAGATVTNVAETFPVSFVKYHKGIQALHSHLSRARIPAWRTLQVLVYYGDAGTGKTKAAIENADGSYFILDQGERVWFDGYDGESTLILDDFYGWIKYGMLLRILDGHPYRAEIKGSFRYAEWTKVMITSNKHPSEWYSQGLTPALNRRINEIQYFPYINSKLHN